MLDIQFIRENVELVKEKSKQKGYQVDVDRLIELDKVRKEAMAQIEQLRKRRNEIAESMKGGKPSPALIEEGKSIKTELADKETTLEAIDTEWLALLKAVPNMPTDDTPVGLSEDENQVVFTWGEKPSFAFPIKNHAEIASSKGWLDKERAAKVTGSRFAYIKGDLALLHMAVVNFGISVLSNEKTIGEIVKKAGLKVSSKPFTPVFPPLMIKTEAYDAMDRLEPRDDRYKIEGEELWLQGSAEHVLGSMHADEVIDEADLPLRYVGFATSFRKEAGTYGKDMEGFLRMHQFDKLEMESLCAPETSLDEHLLMVAIQEYLMQALQLPYQKLQKCTFDIGKPNARGVDIEVWLPGQDKYRETHTADYMTDYQSRRLKTRFRKKDGSLQLIHTNDATAFSQRPLIAILENNQQENGDVLVPEVLRPFMGGRERI